MDFVDDFCIPAFFWLLGLTVAGVILFGSSNLVLNYDTAPGNGQKIGTVVRMQRVGMWCKTWEGQLIRGGMNGGSGAFGTVPFDFTVSNDSLANVVTRAMTAQQEVVIDYRQEGVSKKCRSQSGGTFLSNIRPAK